MEGALVAIVIFAATITRPIEVQLWRMGRLPDGATALLLVSRFPVVALLFGLIIAGPVPGTVVLTVLALLPAVFFYGVVLVALRGEAQRSGIRHRGTRG